jgi:glycosyltransferase involved in cell wall biosynthesis
MKKFDHYIVHTQQTLEFIKDKWDINPDSINIHNIPVNKIFNLDPERNYRKRSTEKLRVLFFGSVRPYKGVDILIEAFSLLPENFKKKVTLVIAGKPLMNVKKLKDAAEKFEIESSIDWKLGFIEDRDIPELFNESDVLVLPYRHIDGSGVLALSLDFSIPVIASNIGGFSELVEDGESGFLVEPENPLALSKCLETVLSDQRLREKMRQNIKKREKETPGWNSFAKECIDAYQHYSQKD